MAEEVGRLARAGADELRAALDAAAGAQEAMAALAPHQRTAILEQAAAGIAGRRNGSLVFPTLLDRVPEGASGTMPTRIMKIPMYLGVCALRSVTPPAFWMVLRILWIVKPKPMSVSGVLTRASRARSAARSVRATANLSSASVPRDR